MAKLVALVNQLVRTSDLGQPVPVVELLRNVLPEREPSPARRLVVPLPVVRVTPQQIARCPLVRYFLDPVQFPDLVQGLDRRRQSSMQSEHLPLDQRRDREVVEQVGQVLPSVRVPVLPHALVVETVNLSDLSRLVVPSQDRDSLLMSHLQRDQ